MHPARTLPHLLLLPLAEPRARSASTHPRLSRGGPGCRVLTMSKMMDRMGEPRLASASVTFDRFLTFSASGSAVEAGVSYDFDVCVDGDVLLYRDDRRVPGNLKAPLRATVLAVYRAAQAERALASLSAAIDRAEAAR